MAQAGYTPIVIYHSTTASAVPTAGNLAPGELALNINDMKLYCENSSGAVTLLASASGASGDVVGPASATDTAVALFDGTTGKLLKNSAVTVGTTGNTVISGTDNSNAMLRITQLGTGNALVVEDDTNPDATPFVVDASGAVIIGSTTGVTGVTNTFQVIGDGVAANIGQSRFTDDANPPNFGQRKARGTKSSPTIVQSGDNLAQYIAQGYDGASYIQAATITASVDGTPGTNDMPGRLVFSTTADGASSPTERMRIDNAGNVGIGQSPPSNSHLAVLGTHASSSGFAQAVYAAGLVDSSTTTRAEGFLSGIGTADAAFTCPSLSQFWATQGTITGGSRTAVTAQYGFHADSTLTGATNNYGFFSNIASGTGRWNFYASGTAANYFGGNTIINGAVGIGTAGSPSYGTSGQVLTSQGSGSPPVWAAASSSTSIGLVRAIAINCILP